MTTRLVNSPDLFIPIHSVMSLVQTSVVTQLLTPIVIDKSIIISNPQLVIRSDHEKIIFFEVIAGKSQLLNIVFLIGGNGLQQTRVILNRGNLQMTDVNILDIHAVSGDGKTIANEGIMTTFGSTRIRHG